MKKQMIEVEKFDALLKDALEIEERCLIAEYNLKVLLGAVMKDGNSGTFGTDELTAETHAALEHLGWSDNCGDGSLWIHEDKINSLTEAANEMEEAQRLGNVLRVPDGCSYADYQAMRDAYGDQPFVVSYENHKDMFRMCREAPKDAE